MALIQPGNDTIAGPIKLDCNGKQLLVEGAWKWSKGNFNGEVLRTPTNQTAGVKRTPQGGYIEGNAFVDQAFIKNILSPEDSILTQKTTCTLTLPTGDSFVLTNAFYIADAEGDTDSGVMSMRWEGDGELIPIS